MRCFVRLGFVIGCIGVDFSFLGEIWVVKEVFSFDTLNSCQKLEIVMFIYCFGEGETENSLCAWCCLAVKMLFVRLEVDDGGGLVSARMVRWF